MNNAKKSTTDLCFTVLIKMDSIDIYSKIKHELYRMKYSSNALVVESLMIKEWILYGILLAKLTAKSSCSLLVVNLF